MLTTEEQLLMDLHSVTVIYKKGEIICKQGALASHIIYMEKGLAKVFLEDGVNSLVLKIIPDGNMLGLSSVNKDNVTYQYSAMAYIDSEIKQINLSFFNQMLGQNPGFAREVINIFGANSVQINGRFFCLTHKQSYGRLADIIICLADRIFKNHEFELPLSRKELAELSGMSSETVIRMLKKFNDEGLIHLKGKYFKILDKSRLRKISETG
ncbi:MAG: Crp/Fnr family transcriptional regulator [Bacteroidales bacterium]|nr:Crp/Fnr family transcriptional regulator [Bacteroidales bacterium]